MIPVVLLKVLKPVLPYLIGIAVVFGVVVYVMVLRHDLAAENVKNVALAQDNQADVAAITAYKAQAVKWSVALAALDAAAGWLRWRTGAGNAHCDDEARGAAAIARLCGFAGGAGGEQPGRGRALHRGAVGGGAGLPGPCYRHQIGTR